METLTQEQHDAAVQAAVAAANAAAEQRIADAVAEAVGPLTAELDTLRQAAAGSELETAVASATAGLKDEVATIQSQLEAAQAQVAALTTERDGLLADKVEFEDAIAAAARKDERVAAVAEIVNFPDTFIAAQADSWAALDDEGWAAKLSEFTGLKDVVGTPAPSTQIPAARSALLATAGAGAPGGQPTESAATRLIRAQRDMTTAPSGN